MCLFLYVCLKNPGPLKIQLIILCQFRNCNSPRGQTFQMNLSFRNNILPMMNPGSEETQLYERSTTSALSYSTFFLQLVALTLAVPGKYHSYQSEYRGNWPGLAYFFLALLGESSPSIARARSPKPGQLYVITRLEIKATCNYTA